MGYRGWGGYFIFEYGTKAENSGQYQIGETYFNPEVKIPAYIKNIFLSALN